MFKYLIKNSKESNYLRALVQNIGTNDKIARDILGMIHNTKTKVVLDDEIKNNYYVFLKDSIYLCNKPEKQVGYQRICVIAHECIHSIQNKMLQWINFILSNIELIAFLVCGIVTLCNIHVHTVFLVYGIIVIISIIPRMILEIGAVHGSVMLAFNYLSTKLKKEDATLIKEVYLFQIKSLSLFFLFSLFGSKLVRIAIVFGLRWL